MQIKDKKQMYEMYAKGLFGNRLNLWLGHDALLKSGFDGLVGVRLIGPPGQSYAHKLPINQAINWGRKQSWPVAYQEISPDEFITIQGEVSDAYYDGIALEYTTVKTHLRSAFELERFSSYGKEAEAILRKHLDLASWEDFLLLWRLYPGSTIEFTTYEICVGEAKGRNTVIWEVRHY